MDRRQRDAVLKAMELIPLGPVLFIDTAGLDDKSEVGKLRIKRTMDMMKKNLSMKGFLSETQSVTFGLDMFIFALLPDLLFGSVGILRTTRIG